MAGRDWRRACLVAGRVGWLAWSGGGQGAGGSGTCGMADSLVNGSLNGSLEKKTFWSDHNYVCSIYVGYSTNYLRYSTLPKKSAF